MPLVKCPLCKHLLDNEQKLIEHAVADHLREVRDGNSLYRCWCGTRWATVGYKLTTSKLVHIQADVVEKSVVMHIHNHGGVMRHMLASGLGVD